MTEIKRLLMEINNKSRFYIKKYIENIYIFDGLTFNFYKCPISFSLKNDNLVYLKANEELVDIIFLYDIISLYQKINKAPFTNNILLNHSNYTVLIDEFYYHIYNKINNKSVIETHDNENYKFIDFYIHKLISKNTVFTENRKSCNKCVFRYLCQFIVSDGEVCNHEYHFFISLISKIFELFDNFEKEKIIKFFKDENCIQKED